MYHFIVNPNSRSGFGIQIWKQIEPIIKDSNCEYKVYLTKFQGHATKITAQITLHSTMHNIVVLGGDGTVNEVINGITDFSKVTLGYIPSGSSNDLARSLNLSTNPEKAISFILDPQNFQFIDTCTLSYAQKSRKFAVSAGIGFDAAVCQQAMVSKLKTFLNKLKLGKLTYAGIAVNQLLISRPKKMTLLLDDETEISFESTYFVAIMNNRYEGGGFKFCPKAKPNDGLLDIMVIAGISKMKILALLPTAFTGKHVYFKGVHTYSCKKVTISSKQALPVHTDGEPIYQQHSITASCNTTQLRIITTS